MGNIPKVAVLVSAGCHPVSGLPRACHGDAVAMGLARKLAGDAARAVHAGDAQHPALADYLALGASTIEVVERVPGAAIAEALAEHVRDADLVLAGTQSEAGPGSGLLPYAIAAALGRPIVGHVLDIAASGEEWHVQQFLPKGKRRRIAVPLKAVLTVHPLAAVSLAYAHARRLSGRIEAAAGPCGTGGPLPGPCWTVEDSPRRHVRLAGPAPASGHARMMAAVATEAKGGTVVFEGSSVDKAQVILNYLRDHRLVDF